MLLAGIIAMIFASCVGGGGQAGQLRHQVHEQDDGGSAEVGVSLCELDESVYFSCLTKGRKTVSICEAAMEGGVSRLSYRFGAENGVELDYSASRDYDYGAGRGFLKNNYHRALVEYTEIAFRASGYEYRVFRRFSDELVDRNGSGAPTRDFGMEVSVAETGEELVGVMCEAVDVDNLKELSLLLDCDNSSALGCVD